MNREIIKTAGAPQPPAAYRQGAKLPVRPKGMRISDAMVALA
jgi:hypothetical protein